MGFKRSATSFATPKTLLQSPPFAGACATAPAETTAFAARFAIIAHLGAVLLRACVGPEPGSSMPHGARRACRACRIGDANGNAAQTGGLARQVRQRMNRLGKPEHRARFCFFSKKKSLAGTRRFPITLEIQIRMGFNCGTLNPCSPKNPSPITALRRRFAPPHPLKPPHLPPDSHHHTPRSHSPCAHA